MPGDSQGEGVLDRTLRVLDCFSEDELELTATELARRTGLATSTLHRLLATLVDRGLLARVPGKRYAIGTRLWELGELAPVSVRLRERAIPHLLRLYEATGENVHLAVLDGPAPAQSSVLYVGRVTGRKSIPTVSRAGGQGPLHTTGVGKALLATRDEAWLAEYFTSPREPETMYSICDEGALRHEIVKTRDRGYASTREEMTLGNLSVATALPELEGLPPVALGVVVHLERADERHLARLVAQAASELTAALREPA